MKRLLIVTLMSAGLLALGICTCAQAQSIESTLGLSYLNQSLNGEKLPNILTSDVLFQLTAPDAFASYRVQFHQDEMLRQQIRTGWKHSGFGIFYDLSILGEGRYSGVGLNACMENCIRLSAIYRRDGYGFDVKLQRLTDSICGSIGYAYDKYGDTFLMGPSVEIGVRF